MITPNDILNKDNTYILKVKENKTWVYFKWADDYNLWRTVENKDDADRMGLRLALNCEDMVSKQKYECEIEPIKWEEK